MSTQNDSQIEILSKMLEKVRSEISGMEEEKLRSLIVQSHDAVYEVPGFFKLSDFNVGLHKGFKLGLYVSEGLRALSEKKEEEGRRGEGMNREDYIEERDRILMVLDSEVQSQLFTDLYRRCVRECKDGTVVHEASRYTKESGIKLVEPKSSIEYPIERQWGV